MDGYPRNLEQRIEFEKVRKSEESWCIGSKVAILGPGN